MARPQPQLEPAAAQSSRSAAYTNPPPRDQQDHTAQRKFRLLIQKEIGLTRTGCRSTHTNLARSPRSLLQAHLPARARKANFSASSIQWLLQGHAQQDEQATTCDPLRARPEPTNRSPRVGASRYPAPLRRHHSYAGRSISPYHVRRRTHCSRWTSQISSTTQTRSPVSCHPPAAAAPITTVPRASAVSSPHSGTAYTEGAHTRPSSSSESTPLNNHDESWSMEKLRSKWSRPFIATLGRALTLDVVVFQASASEKLRFHLGSVARRVRAWTGDDVACHRRYTRAPRASRLPATRPGLITMARGVAGVGPRRTRREVLFVAQAEPARVFLEVDFLV